MATDMETITTPSAPDTSGGGTAPATSTSTVSDAAPPDPGTAAPSFDIDAWDGKSDTLPDDWKAVGKRYEQRMAELENASRDRDEYRLLYEALTDGRDDPRIEQHATELSARDAKLAEIQAAHDKLKADYEAMTGEIQRAQEEYARERWEAFKAANPALARSEKGRAQIAELLNEGFDFDQSAVVAALPRKDADALRALVKSGTAPDIAIELTQLRLGTKRKAEDTSAAHLVAGAVTPSSNPASMVEGRRGKRSYTEAAEEAIAKAFRR